MRFIKQWRRRKKFVRVSELEVGRMYGGWRNWHVYLGRTENKGFMWMYIGNTTSYIKDPVGTFCKFLQLWPKDLQITKQNKKIELSKGDLEKTHLSLSMLPSNILHYLQSKGLKSPDSEVGTIGNGATTTITKANKGYNTQGILNAIYRYNAMLIGHGYNSETVIKFKQYLETQVSQGSISEKDSKLTLDIIGKTKSNTIAEKQTKALLEQVGCAINVFTLMQTQFSPGLTLGIQVIERSLRLRGEEVSKSTVKKVGKAFNYGIREDVRVKDRG